METEQTMEERIAARVAELQSKRRLTKAELAELAQLLYAGPAPRVLPRTYEVPF